MIKSLAVIVTEHSHMLISTLTIFVISWGVGFEVLRPPMLHCTILGRPPRGTGPRGLTEILSFISSIYIVTISPNHISKSNYTSPSRPLKKYF